MTTLPDDRKQELTRLQGRALAVGVLALAACAIGAIFDAEQFLRAYLVAYLFCLGIAHGCFAVLMVYHLTGGAWGYLIRRILEAGMLTLPLLALLFLPIGFGAPVLYDWAQPKLVEVSAGLQHKESYLNVAFFWVRAAVYFALWIGTAYLLGLWSRQQDRTGDPRLAEWLEQLSGPGLVVFGITITFASVDWVMSLQPAFRSTIFGPLFASEEILAGFAAVLVVFAWLALRTPVGNLVSVEALNDLGSLLFTFLIIWAYMGFFQFMLIWMANLRYDVIWYLPRSQGGWQVVAGAVLVLHLIVPFFLLLLRDVKRSPRALGWVAGLILFMHLVYLYFQVMPAFPDTTLADHWMDFLMPFGVGGLWLAYFLWNLKGSPVLALHDANRAAALHYEQHDRQQAALEREAPHG
jgi:hypothetical protein